MFAFPDTALAAATAALLISAPAFAQGAPPGFVRVRDAAPGVIEDLKYAGSDNFMGRPAPGYGGATCWLAGPVAQALARVQASAQRQGLRLVLWDCYRPHRATEAFMRWAADPSDQAMKARYYPAIDKAALFASGYIGRVSAHSGGIAVDLGLADAAGRVLDFGSPFDLFDPKSATASQAVSPAARANRARLRQLMESQGFRNYAREWWHYTFSAGGRPQAWDIPIAP